MEYLKDAIGVLCLFVIPAIGMYISYGFGGIVMEDFIEWIEESMDESFIFSLVVALCIAVMLIMLVASAILTYGATLILPFAYIAYKYFSRNK